MRLIAQGAEARLYKNGAELIKERISKSYRIPEIDNRLRAARTRLEVSLLREARRSGVATPQVIGVDDYQIKMQFVDGKKVKDVLAAKIPSAELKAIGEKIGSSIARMHEYNIIHGDLTTSNMIMHEDKIFFIDFGLGFQSNRIEDKAIDLYLLYHAIESTHWRMLEKLWKIILNTYKKEFKDADNVIKTLKDIEKRGRYKER